MGRQLDDVVDSHWVPFYDCVNFFLTKIVQSNYLTDLNVDGTENLADFLDYYFPENWEEIIVYGVGYWVCLGLGIVLALFFFVLGIALCCVHCCCKSCCSSKKKGCCRCRSPECCDRMRRSNVCTVVMYILLAMITVCLLLAHLPVYFFVVDLKAQLSSEIYSDTISGVSQLEDYLNDSVYEIETVTYDEYVKVEAEVLQTFYDIPSDVMKELDNVTRVDTTLNEVNQVSSQLGALSVTLESADAKASLLQSQTDSLTLVLESLKSDIGSTLVQCGTPPCLQTDALVDSIQVMPNFAVVQLLPLRLAVNASISNGMDEMVDAASLALISIEQDINDTIAPYVEDVEELTKDVEEELYSGLQEIKNVLKEIPFSDVIRSIEEADTTMDLPSEIVFWILIICTIPLSLIVLCNILGMILGIVLPKRTTDKCCTCDKSVAAIAFVNSTVLSVLNGFGYSLLVCSTFFLGAITYTEVCRHVIDFDEVSSFDVLRVFDKWIGYNLQSEYNLQVFETYSNCSFDTPIYTALKLDSYYNLTGMVSGEELEEALNKLKAVNVTLPYVTLMNPVLNESMYMLDAAFISLDFDYIYQSISGDVVIPDLNYVISELQNLNLGSPMDSYIMQLQNIANNDVPEIESGRDELISQLNYTQSIVEITSLSASAELISAAEQTINVNGSFMASLYINQTADDTYALVMDSTTLMIHRLQYEVAKCRPLYDSLTIVVDTTCVKTLYPANGIWFALGICLVLLIPNIFLSLRFIDKYYNPAIRSNQVADMSSSTKSLTSLQCVVEQDEPNSLLRRHNKVHPA